MVPGAPGVGQQGPRESRGRPSGSSNDLLGIYACLKVESSADEQTAGRVQQR